jgi:hypothetical protein
VSHKGAACCRCCLLERGDGVRWDAGQLKQPSAFAIEK